MITFVSELTLAVGSKKRCSGMWFDTDTCAVFVFCGACLGTGVGVVAMNWHPAG